MLVKKLHCILFAMAIIACFHISLESSLFYVYLFIPMKVMAQMDLEATNSVKFGM